MNSTKRVRLRFTMLGLFVFTLVVALAAMFLRGVGPRHFVMYCVLSSYIFTPTAVWFVTQPFGWEDNTQRFLVVKMVLMILFGAWPLVFIVWPIILSVIKMPFLSSGLVCFLSSHVGVVVYLWLPQYMLLASSFDE